MIKKGAMFGLDARIALAIFGALSVISGAALYSAIEDSKVTALQTELNELAKGWEQYYLDTGSIPAIIPTMTYHAASSVLLENSFNLPGWKGPYIQGNYNIITTLGNQYDNYMLYKGNISDNRFMLYYYRNNNFTGLCSATDCYAWARLNYRPGELSIVKKLDLKVDGVIDKDSGLVVYAENDTTGDYIRYRFAPVKQSQF
jgi:hypothetical protein